MSKMMNMENPELYKEVAFLPKRDSHIALSQFGVQGAYAWKEDARVIDLGCGDGSTTAGVLQRHLPPSCRRILGCDSSVRMVQHAGGHYGTDKIQFLKWDITQDVPPHLRGAFDHAFSSYTLQRIQKQKVAFTNIYECLKEGGSCLLLFLGRYPVYDAFRHLSRTEKWAKDLKDVEFFISPYHDSRDPKSEVTALMESIGFKCIDVEVTENTHTYTDDDTFRNLVKTIHPFDVLNTRWDEFMADYYELVPNPTKVDYELIVAKGVK